MVGRYRLMTSACVWISTTEEGWGVIQTSSSRLGLVLTSAEKTTVVEMAEAEGGLSQAALVRRLIRNAAQERGIWPPDQHRIASQLASEVQHG